MYIEKIPHLAELFLYSNDDMFFYRPLSYEDFFSTNGKPIVWLYPPENLDLIEAKQRIDSAQTSDWSKSLLNAWITYTLKRNQKIPYYVPAHSIDAYSKNILESIKLDYPDLYKINSHPFRSGTRIHRLLFSYEMITTYHCKFILRKKTNFWARLKSKFIKPNNFVAVSREDLSKLRRDLAIFNPKTFCLNNVLTGHEACAHQFLQSLWPSPAPWEKSPPIM